MSTTVSVAGSSYSVPAEGDSGWANDVTNLLIQLATSTKVLQSSTSSFPLLSELDFGSSYGLKSLYFKSRATNPSSSGIVRLGNNESIGFRNAANNADLLLKASAANILEFNGNAVLDAGGTGLSGLITNSMVSASAAIDYSKLNLATSIVNADINASAAIAYSKLNLSSSIVNADIASGAAIAYSKLSIANNDLTIAKTSGLQTALDSKVDKSLTSSTGDMIYASGASTPARLPIGSSGQVIKSVGGVPTWATFSGGINYLSSNPDAEADTSGWSVYADAAGSLPVDGTGGSPSSTFTRSTSNPLRGSASFLWTKSAANRQGEGVSYDFTIDATDKAKVLQVSFDYKIASGTYADGDLTCYLLDVTNNVIIQPAGYSIQNAGVSMAQKATFQTASNSTSYRLIIHTASTSASAYTVQFDNFSVGPLAISNTGSVNVVRYNTNSAQSIPNLTYTTLIYDTKEIETVGGYNTSTGIFTVPSSGQWTITSAIGIAPTSLVQGKFLVLELWVNGTSNLTIVKNQVAVNVDDYMFINGSTTVTLKANDQINIRAYHNNGNTWSLNSNSAHNHLTITKVASNTVGSEGVVVAARIVATGSTTVPASGALAKIQYNSVQADTHSAFNPSTYQYQVPIAGWYEINASMRYDAAAWSLLNRVDMLLYVDNSFSTYLNSYSLPVGGTYYPSSTSGVALQYLNAGQVIDVQTRHGESASRNTLTDTTVNFLEIKRISGPATIAPTETVAASYSISSNYSVSANNPVNFDTKIDDSHGAVTTGASWKFTAPVSGRYQILVSSAITTGSCKLYLYKNGSSQYALISMTTGVQGSGGMIRLNAGDYISAVSDQAKIYVASTNSTIHIVRIGN